MSAAIAGTQGRLVHVEAHIADGLPTFMIVGLPDTAVSEARERVRAALASSGCPWRPSRTTINLSPASVHKHGTALDLALAMALLDAVGHLARSTREVVFLGELGLDGYIRPVRGILPATLAAQEAGVETVVVSSANRAEARLVPGISVLGVDHLCDVIAEFGGRPGPQPARPPHLDQDLANAAAHESDEVVGDMADVVGQDEAKFAVEVAAAGGHHLMLIGPPGTGKSMLAARLPGILPDLDDDEALEVTGIHSVAGTYRGDRLIRRPPFENPHHTATGVAIVGGGAGLARPGAASRAHRGVLLLDEAPEFSPRVLDALRQPLETGDLVIHRARGAARFNARFQLVLTANPCPCGNASGKGAACTCTVRARTTYLNRLSGPLMDRIDMRVPVERVTRGAVALSRNTDSTAVIAARVKAARSRASHRLRATAWRTNAEVPGPYLRSGRGGIDPKAIALVSAAVERGQLTMRGMDRVLRLAWTLADLTDQSEPGPDTIFQAMAMRASGPNPG